MMKASTYDKVSSMLIAWLILAIVAVLVLFALWLSMQVFQRPLAVPVELLPVGEGGGLDSGAEFDPNVIDPGDPNVVQESLTLQETFQSVVNIVSSNAALFSDVSPLDDALLTEGGKRGDGRTKGNGIGKAGRPRRWEFFFDKGITVPEYARLLDELGIELGVLKPGGRVVYVSQLAAPKPIVREGASEDETRYYLTWTKSSADSGDKEILEKVGIEGGLILKFLSQETERYLQTLELEKAGDRRLMIHQTAFTIQRTPEGPKFVVFEQTYSP